MTRDEMIEALVENTCRVVFTKVNGDKRDMTCTLKSDNIPTEMQEKSENRKVANPETLPVFDLKAEGWRSFRIENVVSFDIV